MMKLYFSEMVMIIHLDIVKFMIMPSLSVNHIKFMRQ
ncbi:hypothetical protein NX02_19210 [Sphingomonas sanxanigenens DSM 19645 = NX02]|uniref:Uncharacterized protein n=1 Tax=Sphingomonas sanxanigenens DSM 19645 = NX02 TaxID=1123269 RepID=W0AEK0_9SPHN|nr:hypothetical protein NX02_19210 [Sphingomonas sanxanigenens DSM 19645 = NX02]